MLRAAALLIVSAGYCVVAPSIAAADCASGVSGSGRAAHARNFDPPKSYDTETLARTRAIAAWTSAVSRACPAFAPSWQLASRQDVFCEGYAGGLECEANAAPAKRR